MELGGEKDRILPAISFALFLTFYSVSNDVPFFKRKKMIQWIFLKSISCNRRKCGIARKLKLME